MQVKMLRLLCCMTAWHLANPAAVAQSTYFMISLRNARQLEAQGDMRHAGSTYFSMLNNQCSPGGTDGNLPVAKKILVGRRAIACLTLAARKELQKPDLDLMECESVNLLERCYAEMGKLEATSPTWPYLAALQQCALGRYIEARDLLKTSIATTGGEQSIRRKAKALFDHINAFANKDAAMLKEEDRLALQHFLSGQAAADYGEYHPTASSSSSSETKKDTPDYERRARDAESRGDYGAADRFRSGGTSIEDSSKYW